MIPFTFSSASTTTDKPKADAEMMTQEEKAATATELKIHQALEAEEDEQMAPYVNAYVRWRSVRTRVELWVSQWAPRHTVDEEEKVV